MNFPTVQIKATDRVRERFGEELIQHLVDRSLHKMSECPEQVPLWVSHYRTVYGEVTVVYFKDVQMAKVTDDDLDDVRAQLGACVGKAMEILTGKETQDGIAIFHAASPSLTEGEKVELSKGFDIEGE